MQEIMGNKLTKVKEEDTDSLQVQLEVKEIMDILPHNNNRSEKGLAKVKEIN